SERERLQSASQATERRFAFLAEASSVLGASLDYDVTLTNIAKLAVPFVADWCTVDLLEPGGGVRRVALAHGNPGLRAEIVRAASGYPPDPDGTHPRTRVLASGRAALSRRAAGAGAGRGGESGEGRVPGRRVARAAYAARGGPALGAHARPGWARSRPHRARRGHDRAQHAAPGPSRGGPSRRLAH